MTPIKTATNTAGTPITSSAYPAGIAITPDGEDRLRHRRDTEYSGTRDADHAPPPTPQAPPITLSGYPMCDRDHPEREDRLRRQLPDRSGTVTPISTATNTAGKPISVGVGPVAIAIGPPSLHRHQR